MTEQRTEELEIILALFAPDTGHADGYLFKGNPNLPCQCGFSKVVGHYRWALRRAKEIAAQHIGAIYEAREPFCEGDCEALDAKSALLAEAKRDFEIASKASHLFEEAASNWMVRAQATEALLAEAEKALEPFAKWASVPTAKPTLDDCERASAVLAKIKAAQE